MKIKLLALFIFSLFISACEDHNHETETKGNLDLIIKAKYGTEPLVIEKNYVYFGNDTVKFTNLEFFLSKVSLTGSHSHSLTNITFVDLDSKLKSLSESEAGYIIQFKDVNAVNYTGINLSIGVPSDLNAKTPNDFTVLDPLGEPARYWDGWKSYIFSKVEGKYLNSQTCKSVGFVYHSGFDTAFRSVETVKPILVEAGKTTTITMEIDFKLVFGNSGNHIDFCADPVFHEANAFMTGFMDRFQSSITIK
jgi:hypothetical protein